MFEKRNWDADVIVATVVATMSRLVDGAYLLFCIAMLGGVLFIVGACGLASPQIKTALDNVPDSLFYCVGGWMTFSFFFLFTYLIYLAREVQNSKDRLAELEKKVAAYAVDEKN